MNLYFRFRDQYVCAPPKCGGTALYCCALGITPGGRSEFSRAQELTDFVSPAFALAQGIPVILAVRDPVERFASLWRDKCRDGDHNLPHLGGLSPASLMDLVEEQPEADAHWTAQCSHWLPGVEAVHYLEFQARIGLRPKRVNVTCRRPLDADMPATRILNHYAADQRLYLTVTTQKP